LYLQSAGTGVVRVNYTGGLGGFEVYTGNDQTMQLTANSSGITIPEYIIHASDTDTKFGFAGADTFLVHVGGGDRLKVETSGTVLLSDGGNADGSVLYLKHPNNNTTDTIASIFFGNNADTTLSAIVTETNGANNTSNLKFRTSNAGTIGTALTLNADNSATFAGAITANGITSTDNININRGTDGSVVFQSSGASKFLIGYDSSPESFRIYNYVASETALKIDASDSNVTFAGDIIPDGDIVNNTGNLSITQNANDGAIRFNADDGSGGVAEYFRMDGADELNKFFKDARFGDSVECTFGGDNDLKIYHNGTKSVINNSTGNLEINNAHNDGDIIFKSDNGQGATTTYFSLDGSAATHNGSATTSLTTNWPDNSKITLGGSNDLQVFHNATDSYALNGTGNFYIANNADDKDLILQCDDGSGGTTAYLTLDGSEGYTSFAKNLRILDSVYTQYGTSGDFSIGHNGTNTTVQNYTGDLTFTQNSNDKDIIFQSDDGSGGVKEYFRLDGSAATSSGITTTLFPDNSKLKLGAGGDFVFFHDGTDSTITNNSGDVVIQNAANDKDIMLKSDDGSGGTTSYITLDGSNVSVNILTQKVIMANLPTSDPSVDGQLWNSNGTLKVSAGE